MGPLPKGATKMFNQVKTFFLLTLLSTLVVLAGGAMGGHDGLLIALIVALIFNAFTYFYSDKMVLRMYRAKPLSQKEYGYIYDIVTDLASHARMPTPKLWIVETANANAFATGRNPRNSSVAVTTGLLEILDHNELRGVLAHELSHIKNRDILIGTIAATLAAALTYLADMIRWSMWFGGSRRERNNSNLLVYLVVIIIVPFAAMLLRLAISRSREHAADETGSKISHDPLALASALEKISRSPALSQSPSYAQASAAGLFISNPYKLSGLTGIFSTHPPIKDRIKRLQSQAKI
jgi:heat shock protein HtpX